MPNITQPGPVKGVAASFPPDLITEPTPHKSHEFPLSEEVVCRLQQITEDRRVHQHHVLIAALRILHFHYSKVEDAYIASCSSNIGMKPFPVSLYIDPALSLQQAVDMVEVTIEKAKAERDADTETNTGACAELLVEFPQNGSRDGTRTGFDMIWRFFGVKKCEVLFDPSLYSVGAIESLSINFVDVLEAVITTPNMHVTNVAFPHALGQLQQLGVPLKQPWPPLIPSRLTEAFEHVVRQHGSEIAIVQQTLCLTYQQVDVLSSILAMRFKARSNSTQSSDRIAFCIPPSALAIITILAVLKSGCTYVPLDVRDPPGRLRTILGDSGASSLVITSQSPPSLLKGDISSVSLIDVTDFLEDWDDLLSGPPPPPRATEHHATSEVACLLYTSGTTGKPKGVRVMQRAIIALASNKDVFPHGPGNRVAQLNNLAWDAHIIDIWGTLLSGATMISFSRYDVLDPYQLSALFKLAEIDICMFPTALFRHILATSPELLETVRHLMVGGEASHFEFFHEARAINPDLRIINLYGPTEACVFGTKFIAGLEMPQKGPVPIGTPVSTSRVRITDACGRLVPPGVVGEIWLGGEGVTGGYHELPEETARSYIEMKIQEVDTSSSTFYRTGDKGKWNFDGQVEFLGRVSSGQIKIRGQRLELSEVEATIVRATGARDAAVVCHTPDNTDNPLLVVYAVPQQNSSQVDGLEKNTKIVEAWAEHYDEAYSDDIVKIRKQFLGWDSMVTGEPIPHHEMEEWLKDTLRPFFDCKPRTVFEVGCGIGIFLYPMVPSVDHFYAIEPSSAGVERLETELSRDGISDKVSLWASSADKIQNLPDFQVDFVLINSVAQYFPSNDYLRDALLQLVKRCNPGSRIMLGDVRSAPLDDLLATDITMEQWKDDLSTRTIQDLLDRIAKRRQYLTELLVDPTLFFDLQREESKITHVEIIPKIMSHSNELSRYRYQVILHIQGDQARTQPSVWISPNEQDHGFDSLPQVLDEFVDSGESLLAVERIPNKFLAWEEEIVKIASNPSTDRTTTLDTLPHSDTEYKGWSAFTLVELAESRGLSVQLSSARQREGTTLDAVFMRVGSSPTPLACFKEASLNSISGLQTHRINQLTQMPKKMQNIRFEDALETMKAELPAYMMPEALYAVEWLPLTSSGKLDRRILAQMAASDYEGGFGGKQGAANDVPQNETERIVCELFSEILSKNDVSRKSNFFNLGGHSLKATRLRSALERKFKVSVPLKDLFSESTPEQIALKVQTLQLATTHAPSRQETQEEEVTGELTELSFAQGRLWFLSQLVPAGNEYNSPYILELNGEINEEVLAETIEEIVNRHDILRTIFVERDGVPKSKVADIMPKLETVTLNEELDDAEVHAVVGEYTMRPFDLSREPAFKPILFRRGSGKFILCILMHHIITDGQSHDVLRTELISIYTAFLERKHHTLPDLPTRYKDFAKWQHSQEFNDLLKSQADYWYSELQGSKPARIPADHQRTSPSENEAGTLVFDCDAELKCKLQALCQREHVTMFMLLLSAFRAVHFEWTGKSDASLGSPIANRHKAEVERMLGFFVNTQVFRLRVHQGQTFTEMLRKTRDLALNAFEHQDIPFDQLVQVLKPPRSALQNPLVEIMFAFQTVNMAPFTLPGLEAEWFDPDQQTTRFDLEVHWSEKSDSLQCVFYYRKGVFEDSTMSKLAGDVMEMLQRIADNPDVELLSDKADLDQVDDNDTARHVYDDETSQEPDGPPQDEIEKQVCLAFETVLGSPHITRQANFFDFGGHSLLVTRTCSLLKQTYNVPIQIGDIFKRPTPAALARHIETLQNEAIPGASTGNALRMKGPAGASGERTPNASLEDEASTPTSSSNDGASTPDTSPPDSSSEYGIDASSSVKGYPLAVPSHYAFSNNPGKPYVFCIPPAGGIGTIFSGLSTASENFNVIGVNDVALSNPDVRDNSLTWDFREQADQYYQQTLKIEEELSPGAKKDDQPLNLLGYSVGGNAAIEVARNALNDGRKVRLFVVDSAYHDFSDLIAQQGPKALERQIEKCVEVAVQLEYRHDMVDMGAQDQAFSELVKACHKRTIRRFYEHRMEDYPGHITFFRNEGNAPHALRKKAASSDEVLLADSHYGLLQAPGSVKTITSKISEVLAA